METARAKGRKGRPAAKPARAPRALQAPKIPDGHRIVCIGGGTGLFTLLSGLKGAYPNARISAVVSMMDSGGSTGRLRDEFGYLPPGDVRKCLVALSNAPQRLRALMEHRFGAGSGLKGHALGNLMLTAFKDIIPGTPGQKEYGAIEAMEEILRIEGKVYPVTLTNCHLKAHLSDGSVVMGETNIDVPKHDARLRIARLELEPRALIFPKTRAALEEADTIVVGPGDLYTSLMPNLLVVGVVGALKRAKRRGAKIIYVVNTMTKRGETDGYAAGDFVRSVQDALDGASIDAALVNTGAISRAQRRAYEAERAQPVRNDLAGARRPIVIASDMVSKEAFARHHPALLARAIGEAISSMRRA